MPTFPFIQTRMLRHAVCCYESDQPEAESVLWKTTYPLLRTNQVQKAELFLKAKKNIFF